MVGINRRDFIKGSIVAGMTMTIPFSRAMGANDDIRVAVIGFRGKGGQHIGVFRKIPGVRVVALCDVDRNILAREVNKFKKRNEKVKACTDLREIMDDDSIDAVVIATPNQWHSLATVWACQAGKDVYVEKPVCHEMWEGRQMVKAARKYNRIVQSGTQNRSDVGLIDALDYIRQGNLGKILWVHGLWYKLRPSIGNVKGPQKVPEQIDYNLWTGPAPLEPLMRKKLHYDWHWIWETGNGDISNLGIHQVDVCRWFIGEAGLPQKSISLGGRFGYRDDGQTPNTHMAYFHYDSAPVILEVRGLPRSKGVRASDSYRGTRAGNIVQCENGYFVGGRGGGWAYDNSDKKIKQFKGDGGAGHQANFIEAVRTRDRNKLAADIKQGYISTSMCHLVNISYRLGRLSPLGRVKEEMNVHEEALNTFENIKEHLEANKVDLKKHPFRLGTWLEWDGRNEKFTGGFPASWANRMMKRQHYREPFVVSENV